MQVVLDRIPYTEVDNDSGLDSPPSHTLMLLGFCSLKNALPNSETPRTYGQSDYAPGKTEHGVLRNHGDGRSGLGRRNVDRDENGDREDICWRRGGCRCCSLQAGPA